ncbi:MAG: CocE/NonD family hydrolase [Promethearchaeia archaeon]
MIHWIILIFRVFAIIFALIFDLNEMLYINLPLIITSRAIFIIAYYINFFKFAERTDDEIKYQFSTKERIYFIAKNIALILIGFLNIYIAIFFAVYSLMIAGVFLQRAGDRQQNRKILNFGRFLYGGSAIIITIIFTSLLYIFTIIPVFLALLLYLYWGSKYANLSREELYIRYKHRIFKSFPKSLQYGIILTLTLPFIIFLAGLYIGGVYFLNNSVYAAIYVFNPVVMLFINLPAIITSRILWILSFFYFHDFDKNFNFLSKRKKQYFLWKNILILTLGVLIVFFAIYIIIYSCMIAIFNYNNYNEDKKALKHKLLVIAAYIILIGSIGLSLFFYFDIIGIICIITSGGLAILSFSLKGRKITIMKKEQIILSIKKRFEKTPSILKYFLIVYIIIVPISIILGTYTLGIPQKETYMIEMRDGTKLATDVYYSPLIGKNPAPVILVRTPYGKDNWADELYVTLYTPQGYHVVIQDFRGCYDSEGDENFLLFTKSYTDGVDTIKWILDQDWCNGKIGSAGASALAINQYFYAGMKDVYNDNDGLKAQSLWFGCPDLYLDAIMEGAYHESSVETWVRSTASINWRYQIDTIFKLINNHDKNSILYNSTTLLQGENVFSNVQVRAIHVGGWYDHFLGGTIRGYMGYDDLGGKRARGHQLLVIGPWTHGAVYGLWQGELIYPINSNGLALLSEWERKLFEESLLGIEHDELWEGNRVAYYLMGDVDDPDCDANYWKFAKDWPLDYKWNKWYFGVDDDGNRILVDDENDLNGFYNFSYDYDPKDPVITRGGNNQPGFDTAGPMDQRPVEEEDGKLRDDVLLFESEVLKKPYTIEGDLKVDLFIKSTCNDTDFMVKLCDVYPDGRRMLILDSALTTRFRKGFFEEHFLTPGKEYNITIDLFATAYQFNKGHKIAVVITSSNYDRYAINPNNGGPIGTPYYSNSKIARNTIITGPGKSCIYFPELKS